MRPRTPPSANFMTAAEGAMAGAKAGAWKESTAEPRERAICDEEGWRKGDDEICSWTAAK